MFHQHQSRSYDFTRMQLVSFNEGPRKTVIMMEEQFQQGNIRYAVI